MRPMHRRHIGSRLHLCRPRVRRLMGAVARTFTYTSALDLASAELFVERLQRSLKHPIHYVNGGWQVLVDGLRDAAERAGARVVEGARVEAVEVGNGRARGVRLRGGQLVWASAVVLATGARDAARLVEEGGSPSLRRIADGLLPVKTVCLDVALERLPAPGNPVVQDLDSPRVTSAHSVYTPRVAPKGGSSRRLQAARSEASRRTGRGRTRTRRPARRCAARLARRTDQAPVPPAHRVRGHAPDRQERRLRGTPWSQGAGDRGSLPGGGLGGSRGLPGGREPGERSAGGLARAGGPRGGAKSDGLRRNALTIRRAAESSFFEDAPGEVRAAVSSADRKRPDAVVTKTLPTSSLQSRSHGYVRGAGDPV